MDVDEVFAFVLSELAETQKNIGLTGVMLENLFCKAPWPTRCEGYIRFQPVISSERASTKGVVFVLPIMDKTLSTAIVNGLVRQAKRVDLQIVAGVQ